MDLYEICVAFTRLKMSPVFEVVHFVLMSLNMKKDLLNSVSFSFERRHPLASWLATMMLCFSGAIFNCLIFGRPFAMVFANHEKIALASLVWYVVNFIPGVFALLSTRPVMSVIASMKEIQRVYSVYNGVKDAGSQFPDQYLVLFVVGFVRGTGAEILMFFARMMAGVLKPNSHQFIAPNVFLYPSSVFKASCVLSIIFILERLKVLQVDHNILFTSLIIVLIYVRLCMVWGLIGDPFIPFENLVSSILFGGMWEAYKRVKSSEQNSSTSNGEAKLKRH